MITINSLYENPGDMVNKTAKFSIGQIINHKLFNYRGVVIDADPAFQNTDEWYDEVALSRPPKDQPWYRVLVHNAVHETYVAERNLEPCLAKKPVNHPMVDTIFQKFENGSYITNLRHN